MANTSEWNCAADYCMMKQAGFMDTIGNTFQQVADWADKNPEMAGGILGAGMGALTTNSLRGTVLGGLAGAGLGYGYGKTPGATLAEKWNSIANKIAPLSEPEVENPLAPDTDSQPQTNNPGEIVNPLKPQE